MRRAVVSVMALVGLMGSAPPATAGQLPATAEPSAPPSASGEPAHGTEVCAIRDDRLIELSGMVATATGYVVMNDGTDVLSRGKVFQLDGSCRPSRTASYPAPGQKDPEDMAVGKDGSIWVADIGDDPLNPRRPNIALWKFPPDLTSGKPTLYRLRYPDGAHNAEALLLGADDTPIIVTRTASTAGIYVPTAPLTPSNSPSQAGAMTKVGEFTPQRTSTSNGLGLLGYFTVTGGANSPDRKKVALRTYSDAYEWDVPDGDVVKAITTGKPRITPLPDEPQGEAIAYSIDGASFLTVSETADLPGDQLPKILRYQPSSGTKPPVAGAGVITKKNSLSWYERLSLSEATSLIAGVGVLGVLLVLAGVIGIMRARSRTQTESGRDRPDAGDPSEDNQPTAVLTAVRDGYADYGYPPGTYASGGHLADGYPAGDSYPPADGYPPEGYDSYGNPQGYGPGYPPGR